MPPDSAPTPSHPHADTSWYQDDVQLLAELQRTRTTPHAPRIAGYEDLREIRRGGQGVVYEATQRSTKRRVAIKVLLDSASFSSSGLRRFEREVDLAAGLRHPHIVRVYDSGVTQDGRAYLVMEYVEGQPFDAWAHHHCLQDPRLVLEVFAKVCDAIQHAHTRGVIHRDLKPSNVRVDAEGQPRVLDFGLAKVADGSSTGSSSQATPGIAHHALDRSLTTTGQFVGSLPFASPEQARGEHDQVDTRSDVYSLGVMLYHVLTGKAPYDTSGPLHLALGAIVSSPPTPARAVRRDLDEPLEVILATALAKDPAHRYQSAGDMAADIRHHLAGEPIAARRESAWRQLRRQVVRYRTFALAGGAMLAVVAGASIFSIHAARTASRERDAARAAQIQAQLDRDAAQTAGQKAQRASARSDATVEFLTNLLGGASPMQTGGGKDVKVADLIDKAAAGLTTSYQDDPATRFELHNVLGETYSQLRMFEQARAQWDKAMALARAQPDALDDPLRRLQIQASAAVSWMMEGKWQEGLDAQLATIREYEAMGIILHKNLSSCWSDVGVAYANTNRKSQAASAYEKVQAALPESEQQSVQAGTLLMNRAFILEDLGQIDQALDTMRRGVEIQARIYGEDNIQTTTARSNLAYMLLQTDKVDEGLAMLEQSVATARRIASESDTRVLMAMNNLGNTYERLDRLEDSKRVLEEAVALWAKHHPGNPRANAALGNLGVTLSKLGDMEGSLRAARASYDLMHAAPTPDPRSLAITAFNLGVSHEKAGRPAEGESFLREAVDITSPDKGYPANRPEHQRFRLGLGLNLLLQQRLPEAESLIRDAIAALEAMDNAGPTTAQAIAGAKAKLAKALETTQQQGPPPTPTPGGN